MNGMKIFGRLIHLVKPLRGWMILAIVLGIAGFVCASAIPVLGAYSLGLIMENQQVSLAWVFWTLAICALLRGILRYGEQACNHFIAFKLLAHIRDLVFAALRRLAPAKLSGRSKGDLISLITSDVELLEVFYAHTISPVCIGILCSLLFAGIGASIHWQIGLLLLVSYGAVALAAPLLYGKTAGKIGRDYRKEAGDLNALVLESTRGISALLQFDQIQSQLKKIFAASHRLFGQERKLKAKTASSTAITNALIVLFGLAMICLCQSLYAKGSISPSQALAAIAGQLSTFGPVVALANLSTGLSQTLGAGQRVLALLDEEPETKDVTVGSIASFGDMELKDVAFSYHDGQPVLKDFSLTIPKGKILGVTGPSGCGKSTMLRLLMRFWDPQQGEVTLSDENLKTVATDTLRQLQGCVMQDTMLFASTIRENLLIARPDATDEELLDACAKASILEFIQSLPQGLDTPVAEMGTSLSAGERQRLGLARAFLHQSAILLLDEPTSNLDALNEGAVLSAIDQEKENRSIVLISHRKGTLGFADQNIVMKNGKIQNP